MSNDYVVHLGKRKPPQDQKNKGPMQCKKTQFKCRYKHSKIKRLKRVPILIIDTMHSRAIKEPETKRDII